MGRPGRPEGTRVRACSCGRRVTGVLGKRVTCPDCKTRVVIKDESGRGKAPRVFLVASKKGKK